MKSSNKLTTIVQDLAISICQHCLVRPHVMIIDSHFHRLPILQRRNSTTIAQRVICIGDIVLTGAGIMTLKGVSIGSEAVLGKGAVVVSVTSASSISAGNPAKVVRLL